MTKRKTFDVARIRDKANRLMALPEGGAWDDKRGQWDGKTSPWGNSTTIGTPAFRAGVEALLTYVLHASGNYRGYNYQPSESLPEDQRNYDHRAGPIRVLRDDADETRRVYH